MDAQVTRLKVQDAIRALGFVIAPNAGVGICNALFRPVSNKQVQLRGMWISNASGIRFLIPS